MNVTLVRCRGPPPGEGGLPTLGGQSPRKDDPVSTSIETISPGFAWNATRVASLLMVVIVAVIALVFWPAFEASEPGAPIGRQSNGLAAPHEQVVVNGEACPQCLP